MKKIGLFMIACFTAVCGFGQNIFMANNGNISFFSETPMENIDATSKNLNCLINTATNDIQYSVLISSFTFEKPLMQEHFNEKYMESEKFPKAKFKGKINEKIDWSKDGEYDITATGELEIHGVTKAYTEKGKLIIKNGAITITGVFDVKIADHKVEIPKLVVKNIAETVNVKHSATLTLYKKK